MTDQTLNRYCDAVCKYLGNPLPTRQEICVALSRHPELKSSQPNLGDIIHAMQFPKRKDPNPVPPKNEKPKRFWDNMTPDELRIWLFGDWCID